MEIRIKSTGSWLTTLYTAPISPKGWLTVWRGKHSRYRGGFVVRALWLGLVIRWGYERPNVLSWEEQFWAN